MIRFGELAPDVADLNTEVARVANNVIPGVNSYTPLPSFSAQYNALDGVCKGATTLADSSLNKYIFAGDATKLYSLTASATTDESKVGGYTDNDEKWSFIKWYDTASGNEWVIASKFGDTPQYLQLGSSTFADLPGTPPQGRTMSTVRQFIFIGNTWDSVDGNVTNRVRWSGFDDGDEWTSGTNQSDFQDLQGKGGAVQRIVGGEYGTIFQERSIWRATYVGTPLIFQFDEVVPGIGTPAGGSVVQYGEDIFYLSQDGFYLLKNGTNNQPIGVNKIDRYFYNDLNVAYIDNITASISPEAGFVIWAYPSTASSDGTCDKVIAYNYKSGRWGTGDISTQLIFQGAPSAYTLEELDDFGNMDTITTSLDSSAWQGGAFKLAAFNTSNQMGFFSGSPLAATIETGEITETHYTTQVCSVRPLVDGDTTIKVSTRDELRDTPVDSITASPDASGKCNFRNSGRYHRITVNTSGAFTNAIGVEVDIKRRGKR